MDIKQQFSENVKEQLKLLDKKIDNLLALTGIKMVEEVRRLQDVNNNYATRRLSNHTNYKIKNHTLTFGSNASSNGYNYGLVQEYGRKPGTWPYFLAIYAWIEKKVRLGHMTLEKSLGKNYAARVGQLTFLISAKIKAKGIKGKFFYKKAFELGNEFFLGRFNSVMIEVFG